MKQSSAHPLVVHETDAPGIGGSMKSTDDLCAEAARMRELAHTVTDPEVLAEINEMIKEWERRAREMGDGSG